MSLNRLERYGEVMDVNLPRDKTTGKTRGFAFLMYEDQRSTVLAVDNLNGANVVGKTLRVDHVKNYKQPKVKGDDGEWEEPEEQSLNARPEMVIGEWLPSKFWADFNACWLHRWRSSFGIRCVLGYFHRS
jgi:RNA recognition motif-containing protein